MADQMINGLPVKATTQAGDKALISGVAEEYLIDIDKLADIVLSKLTNKTFALDQGTMTLLAALNALNSKFAPIIKKSYEKLESGDDLNLITKTGVFVCERSSLAEYIKNTPSGLKTAFKLVNEEITSEDWVRQTIYVNASGETYIRSITKGASTKSEWVKNLTEKVGIAN